MTTRVTEGLPLEGALLARTTSYSLSLGAEESVFALDVPEFGRGCALRADANAAGELVQARIEVSNASGALASVFEARSGQPDFPDGFYTVTVSTASAGEERTVVLEGRPGFEVLEERGFRPVLTHRALVWQIAGFERK